MILHPAEPGDFKPVLITAESFVNLPPVALHALALLVNEESDANDADILIQCAAFKELVYG